jgi:RNA polymerase sigma factor (sigma-70 family)
VYAPLAEGTAMTAARMDDLVRGFARGDAAPATDAHLLARFLADRDAAALAALVRRHAAMVWGVCRRALPHHDAEDAFQATFLVLVRKAGSVTSPNKLAAWLYGVAVQTAKKARAVAAKRGTRERQGTTMPEPPAREQECVLDEELSRLPAIYREAIVLCELEGRTRKEAARHLGVPEGTLAARLARGKKLLAKQLARLGYGAASVALARPAVAAPPSVVSNTVYALTTVAAGTAEAGVVSERAAALTNKVLKAMLMTKLKAVTAGCVVALAVVWLGLSSVVGQTDPPKAKPLDAKVQKPGRFTGKLVLFGVQGGPGAKDGQQIVALDPTVFTADGVDTDALAKKTEVVFTAPAGNVITAGRVSPDGRALAFNTTAADDSKAALWLLKPGATEPTKLTDDASVQAWAPDGKTLLCVRRFDPTKHESVTLDLSDPDKPTETKVDLPGRAWVEDWAPDGKQLLVTTYPEKEFIHPRIPGPYPLRQTYLADRAGKKGTTLSADVMHDDLFPRFSPDGRRVAFGQRRHDNGGIFYSLMVCDRDGAGGRELVNLNVQAAGHGWDDLRENAPPCWSPDGKTVVLLALGRVADKRGPKPTPGTLTATLVFATPEKGFQKLVTADALGFTFIGKADWR